MKAEELSAELSTVVFRPQVYISISTMFLSDNVVYALQGL